MISKLSQHYDELEKQLNALYRATEKEVLKEKQVIGATTTGAAKYRALLQRVKIRTVLMEEAGEVLEAHCLTALSDSVQRVVMIGDHKQLRPKIESHALTVAAGAGYDLNRSLFERLILGGLSHTVLTVQHRMRPEISAIARHMTYPELLDGPRVAERPHVSGLASDVVFIHHTVPEAEESRGSKGLLGPSQSKVNSHEADLSVQIVRFLLAHGYQPSDMAVLTPYLGQLRVIKDRLQRARLGSEIGDLDRQELEEEGQEPAELDAASSDEAGEAGEAGEDCEDGEDGEDVDKKEVHQHPAVRVSTVDNYQGEEANIIICSLVRSNAEGNIGFLGVADAEQRVNVLCTRARCGLILLGNAECLGKKSPMWQKIFTLLARSRQIFQGLPVKCKNHGALVRAEQLATPEALKCLVDRGAGCSERCDSLLPCGHPCRLRCHPYGHDRVKCQVECPDICRAKLHRVMRKCCDPAAPPCEVMVVDKCINGHPVVRQCRQLLCTVDCKICKVLNKAERDHERLGSWLSERKLKLLETLAARAAPAEAPLQEVVLEEGFQSGLVKLQQQVNEKRRVLEEDLARQLKKAEDDARRRVEEAGRQVDDHKQKMQEHLQQTLDEVEEELRHMEERVKEQDQAAKAQAEAAVQDRDQRLQLLADELHRRLEATKRELRQVPGPSTELLEERLEEVRKMAAPQRCGICFDDFASSDGVQCQALGDAHFLCKGCFAEHIKNEAERDTFTGEVRCPYATDGCDSKPYASHVMAWMAPEAFEVYNSKCLKLREAKLVKDMEEDFKARLAQKERESFEEAAVKRATEHIREEILTLRCPRCSQAFTDFEGCFALTCSRVTCRCGFCAYCLKDCGKDAHRCAAECAQRRGHNDVFGTREWFEEVQRERRQKLLDEYLGRTEFQNGLAARIRDACMHQLQELDL